MFIHNFIYNIKIAMRTKANILWGFVFIVALGTLFKVSFGDIYKNVETLKGIRVAVCIDDGEVQDNFKNTIEDMSLSDDGEKLLEVTYVDTMDEAKKLLKDEKVTGVFFSRENSLKLMVDGDDYSESILASIALKYQQIVTIMNQVGRDNPAELKNVMINLLTDNGNNKEIVLTDGNMDVYVAYFFNLIAMACLMSCGNAIDVVVGNQANLSTLGARKTTSGTNLTILGISGLLASCVVQIISSILAYGYLNLIGVNFGSHVAGYILIIIVGNFTGMSVGYFIGSIGKISASAKTGIGTAFCVITAFLSGLMVVEMRMIVQESCPIINKINPSALIADSFYALNIFDAYDRFIENMVSLLIISVVFIVAGSILGRRKEYASI